MKRYVAVDCGKYNTKVAAFDCKTGEQAKVKFRTKISEGSFEDDMLERGTYIVQVDGGPVYKVGQGARTEAELETSKKSEIHKICTMAAVALMSGGADDLNVVAGIPFQQGCDPIARREYRDYIIPEGEHEVIIKRSGSEAPEKVKVSFNQRKIYLESVGVLYMYPKKLDEVTGIVDIGNLNTNNTYCANYQPVQENSFTDELGGEILITGLAQELSSELGARVDKNIVAQTLLRPLEKRCLVPKSGNKEVMEKSRTIINEYLLEHVQQIKRKLDARKWPVDYMNICLIGGTVKILYPELQKVFGEIFIPDEPEFVNVEGFLRKFCADDDIDITKKSSASN